VRVRDAVGATDVATVSVRVGPQLAATISTPAAGAVAAVGSTVSFSGRGVDAAGRALPASALSWTADLLHCPSACHTHPGIFSAEGVASGSFVLPDHEYPAAIELHLTATANGHSTTVTRRIDFRGTSLTFRTATTSGASPTGIPLTVNDTTAASPVVRSVATNGTVTISAPATTMIGFFRYAFVSWSDGGARTHDITVPTVATTLTALYQIVGHGSTGVSVSPPVPLGKGG
jgi:hypothetical protein